MPSPDPDPENERFFRQLDRKLKAMSPLARKRRLRKLQTGGSDWLTLAQTLEMVCLSANVDPWRGEVLVREKLSSGEIPWRGVVEIPPPRDDKGLH